MVERKEYELNLYDYWRILRRRKWTIILAVLLTEALTVFYTSKVTPIYEASCSVEIERRFTQTGFLQEFFTWYPGDIMSTEARIIKSRPVIEEVVKKLGLAGKNPKPEEIDRKVSEIISRVSVKREANSNVLNIKVASTDPKEAAVIANTIAEVYVIKSVERKTERDRELRKFIEEQLKFAKAKLEDSEEAIRLFEQTGKITGVRSNLKQQLASLKLELSELLHKFTENHPRVKAVKRRIKDVESLLAAVSKEDLAYMRLKRELDLNLQLYTLLSKKYKDALIAEADKAPNVHVINPATPPSRPVRPNKKMNYMMGFILGIFLGIIGAIVRENLDTSIGTIEEVEEYLQVPVLAVIPRIGEKEKSKDIKEKLIIFSDPKSPIAESFRTLFTNIELSDIEATSKTVLFTSTSLKEGKSLVVSNTSLAAAQMGKKVLLVESDLRKPVIHRIFGVPKEPGLTNYLLGNVNFDEIIRGTTDILLGAIDPALIAKTWGIENFSLITSGPLPPNPSELFNSKIFFEFLERVKERFDVIMFDSAPVLPVADASILSPKLDGVVIVYKVGVTARGALRRAKIQIEQAKGKVLGIVLNDIRAAELMDTGYYYYYYHRYYSEEEEKG
ncbi:MAG: hypothetical protein DRI36_01645 [Caldiserica bacterium]|nr:MAG: hypothetical protein DRI36_01645 [Caldisericota bacterium]